MKTIALLSIPVALSVGLLAASCATFWLPRQAVSLAALLIRAVPVTRLASVSGLDPGIENLLARVDSIRRFAREELGLRETKSYTTFIQTDREYVVRVVSACPELSFERKCWSYPILGKLPYRGFFDDGDARREARRLAARGYDVIARPTTAFSMLGMVPDPLFSFMTEYETGDLAELVIHELVHATVFVRGQSGFNEELATFIGRKGAERYLLSAGAALAAYRNGLSDAGRFSSFLRETGRELGEVYSSGGSRDEKLVRKRSIIARRAAEYVELSPPFSGGAYASFDMGRVDNAYIDLYMLYEGEPGLYQRFFDRCADGDLAAFVHSIAELAKTGVDVKVAMKKILERVL